MSIFFYLVLNISTFDSYYSHGIYKSVEEIRQGLTENERLIKAWRVAEEVAV